MVLTESRGSITDMSGWKPIEKIDFEQPIWVLKYDIYFNESGNFCSAETPNARKFTDCHGWYSTEEDALKVRAHFTDPSAYRVEKVYRRVLL